MWGSALHNDDDLRKRLHHTIPMERFRYCQFLRYTNLWIALYSFTMKFVTHLSVCLCVRKKTQKLWTDCNEIFRIDLEDEMCCPEDSRFPERFEIITVLERKQGFSVWTFIIEWTRDHWLVQLNCEHEFCLINW